jgi:hypothetical protein
MKGLDPREASEPMQERTDQPQTRETAERREEQPTWRKTTPRGNQEIHRADLERSTERLEMLLGH